MELTVEEMRRTLASFEWDAREWETFATSPPAGDLPIDKVVISGIAAYAYKQANVLRRMADTFIDDWYHLLETLPIGVPWLKEYTRPPETKRHRLVSNVEIYHPASYTPENESSDPDPDEAALDDIDGGSCDTLVDSLEDRLNDLLL